MNTINLNGETIDYNMIGCRFTNKMLFCDYNLLGFNYQLKYRRIINLI